MRIAKTLLAVSGLAAALAYPAAAAAPEWLRAISREALPAYPADTAAVMLLDEVVITIAENGEVKSVYRRAYRILRPEGRELGTVAVMLSQERRLNSLKAWSLPPAGKDYEVKEKDAVEVGDFEDLYTDIRTKVLRIPAAEPNHVIGYEYEVSERPRLLQTTWWFQDRYPVRKARFTLRLPEGWDCKYSWVNHPPQKPYDDLPNVWAWELGDLPAVELEPQMPPPHAIEGRLSVTYAPANAAARAKVAETWEELAQFYRGLTAGRRDATPEIRAKVSELTASSASPLEKVAALAAFAQRDIRYVAIEIGIGGWQPHAATDVFTRRYGDCKDKVTLMSSMLRESGFESHYVLVHTERGVVSPDYPPAMTFNHVILALRLPDEVVDANLYAVMKHPKLGRLLFFDPTDEMTPLGHLPEYLQANYGLLVTDDGGELLPLPLQAPPTNRLYRFGKLELSPAGALTGAVQEVRWGASATERRRDFLRSKGEDRQKVLENFLTGFLTGFMLTQASAENLEKFDQNLVLRYRFSADNYAKRAGNLMMVRPRVLGQKSTDLLEGKERKYPVEFDSPSLQTDTFEITLPAGYKLDELPPALEIDYGFAEYRSKFEVEGNLLRYHREYKVKEVKIPTERLADLKKFFRQIAADERATAVLMRAP